MLESQDALISYIFCKQNHYIMHHDNKYYNGRAKTVSYHLKSYV